jgi:hypothetical protein
MNVARKLTSVVAIVVLAFSAACSVEHSRLVEKSPDGRKTLAIAYRGDWGCGSDGCIVITLAKDGRETEIFRRPGFFPDFAAAAWTADSGGVAIIAQNQYGPIPVMVFLDVSNLVTSFHLESQYQKLIEHQVMSRHPSVNLLSGQLTSWVASDEARRLYQASVARH